MSEITLHLSYDLPAICGCDRDQTRLSHADLEELSPDDLTTEAWRVRLALAFGDLRSPSWAKPWLEERLQRCKALLRGAA